MTLHLDAARAMRATALSLALLPVLYAMPGQAANSCVVQDSETNTQSDGDSYFPVGEDQLACGRSNTAAGDHSTAIGQSNGTNGDEGTAIGYENSVRNGQLTDDFPHEFQLPVGATAVGTKNTADGDRASAFGAGNYAAGEDSSAMGSSNRADGDFSTAVGNSNYLDGDRSSIVGYDNDAFGDDNTAMGSGNGIQIASDAPDGTPPVTRSSAFGYSNYVAGSRGTAVGDSNIARHDDATAIGTDNASEAEGATTVGRDNVAFGIDSSAVGSDNNARGDYTTSMGYANTAGSGWSDANDDGVQDADEYAYYATAMGYRNNAGGHMSTALGSSNFAYGVSTSAVGSSNVAYGDFSAAIGMSTGAIGIGSTAIGGAALELPTEFPPPDANGGITVALSGREFRFEPLNDPDNVLSPYNIVSIDGEAVTYHIVEDDFAASTVNWIGTTMTLEQFSASFTTLAQGGALSFGKYATAVGARATAFGDNSVAMGVGSFAKGAGNTAIGAKATATGANSVALGADSVADRADSVSVGSEGKERQITNVADGTQATDAVNYRQLQAITAGGGAQMLTSANAYTDQLRDDMNLRIGRQDERIDRNGAMGSALVNMGINAAGSNSPRGRIALGFGQQSGERAVSIGYGKRIGERASFSLGGAFSGEENSIGAGIGLDL